MTAGPVLQTERLELRWLTLADASLMLAIWNDAAFLRFVGDRGVRTLEQAEAAMRSGALRLYADYGYGPFHVARRGAAGSLGICGLFRREGLDDPDIGFALLPEFCGLGFGYEAAHAVLRHARDDLRLPRVTAIVAPDNEPSIGLLGKLGMSYERPLRLPGEDHDVSLYGIGFNGGQA